MGPRELSGGSGYRTTVAGAVDGRKKSEH